jgi:hypothetical protein
MIVEKRYRVQLLDGKETTTLYETRQDAIRAHRGNILKLVEVLPKQTTTKVITPPSEQLAIVISARSNEDLNISLDCGYAVMYNSPRKDKIYEGMRYLEVSDEFVLESTIYKLEKYEKSVHTKWGSIVPRFPNKTWKWALFHKNGKLISRKFAEEKYSNPLKGTQGGISYIKL